MSVAGNPKKKGGGKTGTGAIKRVPASVQLLETRLQSADEEIREQAWKSIEKLGAPEEPLIDKCEEQLHHENWFVGFAGANALAFCVDMGSGMAAANAAEPHLDSESQHLRYCAGQIFVGIDQRVAILVDSLKQQKAFTETMASPPPGRLDDLNQKIIAANAPAERAIEMMAQRLVHDNPKVRQNALIHMTKMEWRCVPYAETICTLVLDPDLSVRNELIRTITHLGAFLVDGVHLFAAAMALESETMRRSGRRALLELSKTNGPEVAKSILEHMEDENKVTRIQILELFALLGPLAGVHGKAIAQHLEELDQDVRLTTVRTLVACGRCMQTHYSTFKKKTFHVNPDISRAAVMVLRGLAPICPKFAKNANKDLEEDPALKSRMMALEVLGGAGPNGTPHLEEIVKCLEDGDWNVRRCAIESLADLQENAEDAGSEIARRLLHHDPDVRRAAAETLGRMGMHAGEYGHRVEGLVDTEEDEDVKKTCAAACEMLYKAGMAHG